MIDASHKMIRKLVKLEKNRQRRRFIISAIHCQFLKAAEISTPQKIGNGVCIVMAFIVGDDRLLTRVLSASAAFTRNQNIADSPLHPDSNKHCILVNVTYHTFSFIA